MNKVPHLNIVVFFSVIALAAYGAFSYWVVCYSGDVALTGDVVGTWKSFAVAVIAFWIGSSSGGKAAAAPSQVEVINDADKPVPVETA